MHTITIYIILMFLTLIKCSDSVAQTGLTTRNVATNLDTPWEILWGPDNYIWMTERYGRISRVNPETGEVSELITIPEVFERGESGLMGLVLHPNLTDTPWVFTVYNYRDGNTTKIKLVRYEYDGVVLKSPVVILDNILGADIHDGARLFISEDRKLFMTVGERGVKELAQDLNTLNGKILRMNLDGTAPSDNPFPNSLIWSWGHRNPQGLKIVNGLIYSSEHGASTDDELNIIYKGRNYGWPAVEGYCDKDNEMTICKDSNIVEPILSMNPQRTYAVAGIDYYNHGLISQWNNSILIVCLKDSKLVQAVLNVQMNSVVEEKVFFAGTFGRLRDICISRDGRVFISTSNRDGRGNPAAADDRIIEIKPDVSFEKDRGFNEDVIKAFPNPFSDKIHIVINAKSSQSSNARIFDIFGNVVNNFNITANGLLTWDGINEFNNQCPDGIYTIVINAGMNKHAKKIVKYKN